jgi:hypothetical protein
MGLKMYNTVHPDEMTAKERIGEVASILAQGILRYKKSQKSSKTSLDFKPTESVHGDRYQSGDTL